MSSSVTKSTITFTVVRLDKQIGASGTAVGTWVTLAPTTPDSTTKIGTNTGNIVLDYGAGTLPAVGDTFNGVFN